MSRTGLPCKKRHDISPHSWVRCEICSRNRPFTCDGTGAALADARQIVGAAGVVCAVLVLVWLILRSHRRSKKELLYFKSIVESCGIEAFWPFTTQQEKDSGWKDCTTKMADSEWGEICVAGLTGAHTFADERSPLHKALKEHRGDIRILLIKKDSRAFHQRVTEMAGNDLAKIEDLQDEFRLRLDRSLRFCMRLAEQGTDKLRSIEVREYDRPAIWKMVIFGNYLWLQHYVAGKLASDMPAYVFRRERAETMTPPLERVFEFRWKWGENMVLLHRDRNGEWRVRPELAPPARGISAASLADVFQAAESRS
jgi:hypothetical protein